MRGCVLVAVLVVTCVAVVQAGLELSLQGCRVFATYTGSRRLRRVKFFMSIDQKVSFRKAQYKYMLKCRRVNRGKVCSGVGGPCLAPGQDVYYAQKVKFARRRIIKMKHNKPWVSPITTTSTTIISTTSLPPPGNPLPDPTVFCGKIYEVDVGSLV